MTAVVWRFQSDLQPGVTDPDVTVFIGDTYTNDVTGEQVLYRDTSNPATVKLSQLNGFIANPVRPAGQPSGFGVPVTHTPPS